jgi:F-type H+-transporting ATPase subunit b
MSQIEQLAATFGVDWPHLGAQIASFALVCAILYALAYQPILRMLEARRQQIATGLANAEKIKRELARTAEERRAVLAAADAEARRIVEAARAAATRAAAEETRRASAAADQLMMRAREGAEHDRARLITEIKRDLAQLVVRTTAAVAGKVLTPDDHRRLIEETTKQLKVADDHRQKDAPDSTPAASVVLRR